MKDLVEIEGKHYISSSRAAEISKYSKDYIGQLCRGKKIDSRLIGRSWYVNEESLMSHKREAEEIQRIRHDQYGKSGSVMPHKVENMQVTPPEALVWKYDGPTISLGEPVAPAPAPTPAISAEVLPVPKSIAQSIPPLEWKFSYESDERPLLPKLEKNLPEYIRAEIAKAALMIKSPFFSNVRSSVLTSAAVIFIGIGSVYAMHPDEFIGSITRAAEQTIAALDTASFKLSNSASIADAISSVGSFFGTAKNSIVVAIGNIIGGSNYGNNDGNNGNGETNYAYYPYYTGPITKTTTPTTLTQSIVKPVSTNSRTSAITVATPNQITMVQVDARIEAALKSFTPWQPTYTFISAQSSSDTMAGGIAISQSISSALTNGTANFDGSSLVISGNANVGSLTTGNASFDTIITTGAVTAMGKVGIGTTTPSQTLSVQGNGLFSGDISAANLTATGTLTINNLTVSGATTFTNTGTSTFNGDILARGISAWQYLNVPFIQATSTTATSSFAGGLAVGTNKFVVDSTTGNVGIGTARPLGIFHVSSETESTMYFDRYGGAPPNIIFRRANGTAALPTAVGLDNQLFALGGRGYGATGFSVAGRVAVFGAASETWTDSAQGAYLAFTTTQIGTASAIERLRISDSGNVGIGTTTPWGRLAITGADTLNTTNALVIADSNNAPKMVVTNQGNVGVGTGVP
ncbi:MAG: hypothetical protein NT077_01340 [Candidatus Taylorbacteria bacterium]|nr:hypothetical protein [Candidatus Taylorbacteria bacterium]